MDIPNELYEELVMEAKKALTVCYPADSAYSYSAAVLTDSGKIYSAANYASFTHSLTLHGEQCALVHAASQPRRENNPCHCGY